MHIYTYIYIYMYIVIYMHIYINTADPTWFQIFECCFKAQSPKLEHLFCYVSVKRDLRVFSFELSKMSTHMGLAVYISSPGYSAFVICIYVNENDMLMRMIR